MTDVLRRPARRPTLLTVRTEIGRAEAAQDDLDHRDDSDHRDHSDHADHSDHVDIVYGPGLAPRPGDRLGAPGARLDGTDRYARAITDALTHVWETVAEARAAGQPWSVIARGLGVDEVEARRRFRDLEHLQTTRR